MEKIIKIQCPKCKHKQKSLIRDNQIFGKVKRCVYCGKRFTLNKNNFL